MLQSTNVFAAGAYDSCRGDRTMTKAFALPVKIAVHPELVEGLEHLRQIETGQVVADASTGSARTA
jgi:hypothetical protein